MLKSKYKNNWIFVIIVCAIAFFTMMYEDIHTTSWNAYSLLNSIISGKFPTGYNFESAFYIPVHIAFAIWSIPAFILSKCGIGNPSSIGYLLWMRLMLVVCIFFIIKFLKKILEEAEVTKNTDFWAFFMGSSFLIFAPIFDMGQYDCIGISIGLYALTLIFKDPSKLTFKELILLSIASSFKIFFLFASIAVVFVLERKFKKVLADLGVVLSVSVLFVVLSKVFVAIRTSFIQIDLIASSGYQDLGVSMAARLFNSTIDGGIYKISIVFLFLFALYFLIFLTKKPETKKEAIYEVIYAIAATYFILVTFTIAHPQWSIFPGVFFIILIALSKKADTKKNIILEFIFECSMIIQQLSFYGYVYGNEGEFDRLLLKNFKSHLFGPDLKGVGDITGIMEGKPMIIVSALALVAGAAILIMNHPWKKDVDEEVDEKTLKTAATVRVVFLFMYVAAAFACRFIF